MLRIPPTPFDLARAARIKEALANLVDNAIKYTPAGGHVRIGTAVGSAGVDLWVSDSGPGIPHQDRTRVVDRFVRLEASRNTPGTGLGLSLVAAVAHFHNAALILEDSLPTGLKAILRFPRAALRATSFKNAAQ